MNFLPTDEQRLAVEGFNRFLDTKLEPIVRRYQPDKLIEKERMLEIFQMMLPYGMGGNGLIAEAHGGLGMPWLTYAMMYDNLARVSGDVAISLLIQQLGAYSLEVCSNDAMRQKYLPRMVRAEIIACSGISEPGVGSNVAEVTCRAKADGDHFIVSGEKTWISNGHYSDFCMVIVRTSDEGARGLSMILVDRQEHGYESRNIDKLGLNSTSTAQLFFDNVRVPQRNLIGQEGMGFTFQMLQFQEERLWGAASSLKSLDILIDKTIDYTRQRKAFGKSILDNQVVHFRLAELRTEVEALRALTYRAVEMYVGGKDVTKLASMAKLKCGRLAREVADSCLQYWGGMGFTWDNPISQAYRDTRLVSIGGGADEVMLGIICKLEGTLPKGAH